MYLCKRATCPAHVKNEMDGVCSMGGGFCWGNLRERDQWTGSSWHRIGTGGRHVRMR